MAESGRYAATFVFSALGMICGHRLAATPHPAPVFADAAAEDGLVSLPSFSLVDAEGRRRVLMGTSREGSPGIWFFDRQGKARLSLGLYADDNAFIVLNDDQGHAVEILRTLGPKSAPFLVMKSEGRDRIVMGLADPAMDPFLVYYDAGGAKQTVFGRWR